MGKTIWALGFLAANVQASLSLHSGNGDEAPASTGCDGYVRAILARVSGWAWELSHGHDAGLLLTQTIFEPLTAVFSAECWPVRHVSGSAGMFCRSATHQHVRG